MIQSVDAANGRANDDRMLGYLPGGGRVCEGHGKWVSRRRESKAGFNKKSKKIRIIRRKNWVVFNLNFE